MGYWVNDQKESTIDDRIAAASAITVHLYETVPDRDGAGGTECSGNGYSEHTASGWGSASTTSNITTALNDEVVSFSASGGSIAADGWAIELDGTTWWIDSFDSTVTIGNGETYEFAIGALSITLE